MDTIANFLTTLRNAEMAGHQTVTVPATKMSNGLLTILNQNGYVGTVNAEEKTIQVALIPGKTHSFKRISKPGRRVYVTADRIPVVLGGRGLVIVSTSTGLLSGKDAKKQGLGGEIICEAY